MIKKNVFLKTLVGGSIVIMLVISKYLLSRTVCMILSEVFGYKGQSLPPTACPRPIPGFLKTDLEGGKAYQELEQPDTQPAVAKHREHTTPHLCTEDKSFGCFTIFLFHSAWKAG